jgi:hypothetical protein
MITPEVALGMGWRSDIGEEGGEQVRFMHAR